MTTMADIADRYFPIRMRDCPRCGTPHDRIDFLCEGCRIKDTKNKRAAGLKGQRMLKRMRAARAADPVDPPGDSHLMLHSLLSKVGIRGAG